MSGYSYKPITTAAKGAFVDVLGSFTSANGSVQWQDGSQLHNISRLELLDVKVVGFDCRVSGSDVLPHILFLNFGNLEPGLKLRTKAIPKTIVHFFPDKATGDIVSNLLNIKEQFTNPRTIAWYPDGRGKLIEMTAKLQQNNSTAPTVIPVDSTYTSVYFTLRVHFCNT